MLCPQGRAGRKNFFKPGRRAGQGRKKCPVTVSVPADVFKKKILFCVEQHIFPLNF
jgi:hypothetical protein